jgi:SOS regulatory protein LexA
MQSLEKVKDQLARFYAAHKRMPSYAEATKVFGVSSKDSSYRIMHALIRDGAIGKDKAGKIIPKQLGMGVRVLGLVEAGFPTPAEENLLDTITLDSFMIEHKESSFMLRVKGDSMIDAGIHEGDFVIVERSSEAKPGSIVIADVDGAWTMKYLRKKGNVLYLEPANKNYGPIYPKESLSIAAVVKGVVRKYA